MIKSLKVELNISPVELGVGYSEFRVTAKIDDKKINYLRHINADDLLLDGFFDILMNSAKRIMAEEIKKDKRSVE